MSAIVFEKIVRSLVNKKNIEFVELPIFDTFAHAMVRQLAKLINHNL